MSGDAVLRWCTGTRTEVVLGGGLYHNIPLFLSFEFVLTYKKII